MAKTKRTADRVTAREYVSKRVGPGKRKLSVAESAELADVHARYRQSVLHEKTEKKASSRKPGFHAA